MKRKERGSVPEWFDCLQFANEKFGVQQQQKQERLQQLIKDPTFRYLYKMVKQDAKEQQELEQTETPVNIDQINIKVKHKKGNETIDLR